MTIFEFRIYLVLDVEHLSRVFRTKTEEEGVGLIMNLWVRIDDRLIHGQVVTGWGNHLRLDVLILANDRIRGDAWERSLYENGFCPDMRTEVLSIEETAAALMGGHSKGKNVMVLVESPRDALRLLEEGLRLDKINLGGIHYRPGKREILPYIFLNPGDIQKLAKIKARGVKLECCDVPTGKKVDLCKLIKFK